MSFSCDICCEMRSTKKQKNCPYCDLQICVICHERYLLETINPPHCMKCKKHYSTEFFLSQFSHAFHEKYKEKQKIKLFQQEKLFFQDTMPIVVSLRERDAYKKKIIEKSNLLYALQQEILDMESHYRILNERCQISNYRKKQTQPKQPRIQIQCPQPNCRGICIHHRCPLCESIICSECHQLLLMDENHMCKEEDLQSVKKILQECRSCPQCSVVIYKTDGCDQMWCTHCHVAFSWRTGEIEKGRVHNPHYIDFINQLEEKDRINYQREQFRCQRDDQDPMPSLIEIRNIVKKTPFQDLIYECARMILHISNDERRRFIGSQPRHDFETYGYLRLSFIQNKISEETFKRQLVQKEKCCLKLYELRQIIDAFQLMSGELFQQLVRSKIVNSFFIDQLKTMVLFFHEQFHRNLQMFRSKMHNPFLPLKEYLILHTSS